MKDGTPAGGEQIARYCVYHVVMADEANVDGLLLDLVPNWDDKDELLFHQLRQRKALYERHKKKIEITTEKKSEEKLHHQAQTNTSGLDEADIVTCKSLAHDIASLTQRINNTLSNDTAEVEGKRAIDDKTLSEKWSELLVRTSNSDSSAMDLAEELLNTYALAWEVSYRLKKCLTALENFEFEEAQQHLTL